MAEGLCGDETLARHDASGRLLLLYTEFSVGGRVLSPAECQARWSVSPDETVTLRAVELTPRDAAVWCVKHLIPETLRGFFLESL
jgi:hypothetical protein